MAVIKKTLFANIEFESRCNEHAVAVLLNVVALRYFFVPLYTKK